MDPIVVPIPTPLGTQIVVPVVGPLAESPKRTIDDGFLTDAILVLPFDIDKSVSEIAELQVSRLMPIPPAASASDGLVNRLLFAFCQVGQRSAIFPTYS